MRFSSTLFLCILLTGGSLFARDPALPEEEGAFTQNARLGRGINLGDALEARQEGDWGVVLEEEFFSIIARAGFDSVRIPVRWSAHAQDEPPYTIDPAFFARVDWAVDHALAQGFLVILNIHHYIELMESPQEHRQRFLALWEQIATHYQAYPQELILELLNEPRNNMVPEEWNALIPQAIEVIRKSNPQRYLMVGPARVGGISGLAYLNLPSHERRLIVSVHYYRPYKFTYQGADWVSGAQKWLGRTWGSDEERKEVEEDFDEALRWAEDHNRPLHLGEFGTYRKVDMIDRARWSKFVRQQAEKRGITWAYWDFCGTFGAWDQTERQWHELLLNVLIPQEN